jgi:Fe-S cluster assembly iron-binding protein IscA
MTPAAAEHIRGLTRKQPDLLGVRLGIKQTGCAGFGYVLDTVTQPDKDDLLLKMRVHDCTCRSRRCHLLTAPKWTMCAKV